MARAGKTTSSHIRLKSGIPSGSPDVDVDIAASRHSSTSSGIFAGKQPLHGLDQILLGQINTPSEQSHRPARNADNQLKSSAVDTTTDLDVESKIQIDLVLDHNASFELDTMAPTGPPSANATDASNRPKDVKQTGRVYSQDTSISPTPSTSLLVDTHRSSFNKSYEGNDVDVNKDTLLRKLKSRRNTKENTQESIDQLLSYYDSSPGPVSTLSRTLGLPYRRDTVTQLESADISLSNNTHTSRQTAPHANRCITGTLNFCLHEPMPDLYGMVAVIQGTLKVDSHKVALGWIQGGAAHMRRKNALAGEPIRRVLFARTVPLWQRAAGQGIAPGVKYEVPVRIGLSDKCPSSVSTEFYSIQYTITVKALVKLNPTISVDQCRVDPPPIRSYEPNISPQKHVKTMAVAKTTQFFHLTRVRQINTQLNPNEFNGPSSDVVFSNVSGSSRDNLVHYVMEAPAEVYMEQGFAEVDLQMGLDPSVESVTYAYYVFKQQTQFRVVALSEDLESSKTIRRNALVVHRLNIGQPEKLFTKASQPVVQELSKGMTKVFGRIKSLICTKKKHPIMKSTTPPNQTSSPITSAHGPHKTSSIRRVPSMIFKTRQRSNTNATAYTSISSVSEKTALSTSASTVYPIGPSSHLNPIKGSDGHTYLKLSVPLTPKSRAADRGRLPSSKLDEVRRSHTILIRVGYKLKKANPGESRSWASFKAHREIEIELPVHLVIRKRKE